MIYPFRGALPFPAEAECQPPGNQIAGCSPFSGSCPAAAQRLSADYLARILLVLHCNLELARHPRHAAAALGPLRAALALLGDSVCEPATFRYAASILLRLLTVRRGLSSWLLRLPGM